MASLVLQLQSAALDRDKPISDLLRMALVTAAKLGVTEIEEWLRHELDGYGEAPIPEYRKLRGELRARNPFHGWLPVQFPSAEALERYSIGLIGEPISAIEKLVKDSAVIGFGLPAAIDFNLRKSMNYNVPILLHVQSPTVHTILDAVRNRVLDWSLQLEKAGVVGDGMTFSDREQQRANTINITGNVGVLGNLAGTANIVASTSGSQTIINTQSVLDAVDALRKHLGALPDRQRGETEEQLTALEAEARSDKPDQSRLRSGLSKLGEAASQIGDKVVQAGMKALLDYAIGS